VYPAFLRASRSFAAVATVLAVAVTASLAAVAASKREFPVSAHKYAYRISGGERTDIHVQEGDVVRITFSAEDIAHSFTIDEPYRISKRAEPGKPITFDFLADKPGTFEFYCNLAVDERCQREVRSKLIVDSKPNGR
jgi:heme/copper-type cytochrome/quinol oxidase subunit 2